MRQHRAMARLGGAVGGDQAVARGPAQAAGEQGGCPGDEAVQHHGAAPAGGAQHDAGQHADLETAHLHQHAERVASIGSVALQRPAELGLEDDQHEQGEHGHGVPGQPVEHDGVEHAAEDDDRQGDQGDAAHNGHGRRAGQQAQQPEEHDRDDRDLEQVLQGEAGEGVADIVEEAVHARGPLRTARAAGARPEPRPAGRARRLPHAGPAAPGPSPRHASTACRA